MAIDTATAAKAEIISREQELAGLSQKYGDKLTQLIGEEALNGIPGHTGKEERLFYSGDFPDETKEGLRLVTFIDKGDADSFWAVFNKKYGCALVFSFERENRSATEKDMIVMQYDPPKKSLMMKDVIVTRGRGIEKDVTYSVKDNQLVAKVDSLMRLL